MLADLGFPIKFINWFMECICSVSYSLVLNGELTKPFQGKKGIQQGDLMSPYLFVLAMKYLNRKLNWLDKDKGFHYHPRCKNLEIKHISFVDDLLLFCKAKITSVTHIQEAFHNLSKASGLQANIDKISVHFSGTK